MKAIGKCEVCGGKIIQAGNGNIFCEDCADKNYGEKLRLWAERKEKQRIVRRALAKDDMGDDLCKYCPLEKKGVYGVDGGYVAGCEGSEVSGHGASEEK